MKCHVALARVFGIAAIAIAVVTATGCGSAADRAGTSSAETAASGASKTQKIRVSKVTTRLTEPLTADGDVDYVAAVDRRMRSGVTPENNAAVPFWQALGPAPIDKTVRAEFLTRLGLQLPEHGDYLVAMKDFYEKLPEYGPRRPDEDWKAYEDRMKPWSEATARPWTAAEFPHIARWLEVNEQPLQWVAKAARRPKFYEPCIAMDGRSLSQVFVAGKWHREIIRALNCRALLRFGSGNVEGARSDVNTLYGVARCLRSTGLVNALVGMAAEGMARDRIADVAQSGKLTAQQARQWEAEIGAIPPATWTSTDEEELWLYPFLQNAVQIAHSKPTGEGEQRFYFPVPLALLAEREPMDCNELLTVALVEYDAVVAGRGKPSRQERRQLREQLKREAESIFGFALPEGPFVNPADAAKVAEAIRAATTAQEKNRRIQAVIRMHFADLPLEPTHEAHTRSILNRQLARLSLLLAAYRLEQGEYPSDLAMLHADKSLSVDPFNQQPLHYARKGDGYAIYGPGPDGELHYGTKEHASYPREYSDDVVLNTPNVREAEQAAAP